MKKNNSVRSQQLITACQKSLVREYIKNFVTSPEKVNYEDEIKFKFIADLQKLIRNNQRLSYNPLTDRLLDNKT